MARRSLKPELNQIRTWVRQGRTDAWIAHQLDVSASDIKGFKSEHGLMPEGEGNAESAGAQADQGEMDLRAEDDALVAAALEAEQEAGDEPDENGDGDEEGDADEEGDEKPQRQRRRGRRGGRGRGRRKRTPLEGTFDHGEEGYGLWLDPAVQDDPVYAEHWAGHRPVNVSVEPERIVITRSGEDDTASGEQE